MKIPLVYRLLFYLMGIIRFSLPRGQLLINLAILPIRMRFHRQIQPPDYIWRLLEHLGARFHRNAFGILFPNHAD